MSKNLKNRVSAPNAGEQTIQLIITKAEKLISNKEIEEGIALLENAEEKYPDNPKLKRILGKTLFKEKSAKDGLKKLESALEQFPEDVDLLLELASIHLKPGNTKGANPYAHKALELAPQNPNTHLMMASLNQRKGDLPLAVENYRKAIEVQLKYPTTEEEPEKKDDFEIGKAENLLWSTLALMAENGVHMFPAFGTLLGLVRNGSLLLHDKDIDTGIPFSEMDRTINILKKNGWQEINNSFGYTSPRAMLHLQTKISLDIAGFLIDAQSGKVLTSGAWMPNTPKQWNMIWEFDEIVLEKRSTPENNAQVWFLKKPEKWLETIYGDWQTPDKNFDTMVCAKNLREFSLLTKCFAYSRIFENWTKNNIPRALSLTRAALNHEPNDGLLKRVLHRLEERRK
ncbi:hypothetical protein PAEH1_00315 [Paenalcaligenes hominis]|uniref:Uncharacterized protein n=1 Tax=Paenalcaligenes hominis TaxID=643674 RepID=A0A1U9JX75_9BURK|nr:hypothetical protein [Paenalcaligenes hominis]AQS50372.1 hypothetical protein PAEH1_00315 [Paenalcaligenes hominis]